ncbi:MAG: amidohydrolase [Thermodesulfobacteriota bacterium]
MQGLFADLVIRNSNVLTVDADDTSAEGVAVRDDKIVRVGSDREIQPLIGADTRVLDLGGRTVVPGFIDSHTHNAHLAEFRYSFKLLNLAAELNPTIAEVLCKLKAKAGETPPGEWIGGKYFDPKGLREARWPTLQELDACSPDHPVMISIRGGHACAVNSRALEIAGITGDTPDPQGGIIERDPLTGQPTGVLRDVMSIRTAPPAATLQELKEALVEISHEYIKTGVTSTGDAGATDRPEPYRAYQETVAEGRLKTRTYLMIRQAFYRQNDLGLRTGFGNDRLRLGPVKLFVDGSIQCFTCAFHEPYVTGQTRGLEGLRYSQAQLDEIVAEAHRLGYQVAIHAQGDCGIRVAVDAIEQAMEKHPRPDPRHRIEHALCPTAEDLERMKRLGIIANFYFFHPWFWGDQHMNHFIGPERAHRMAPAKTAMRMGIVACAHSDCPVCMPNDPVWPANPLWGMWCAVNRKTRSGRNIGPDERLTPLEALRAYTINGAYASFEEDIKGSIETGKLADMVVLSHSPLTVDPWKIRDIEVLKTIIGGEVVYEKP